MILLGKVKLHFKLSISTLIRPHYDFPFSNFQLKLKNCDTFCLKHHDKFPFLAPPLLIFELGLKCDPSCKLYKKAYHIRNSRGFGLNVDGSWRVLKHTFDHLTFSDLLL